MPQAEEQSGLRRLLGLEKKREVQNLARSLRITGDDFVSLILSCERLESGYIHLIHHRDIVPEHLRLTANDLQTMGDGVEVGKQLEGGARKVFNKITQTFKDRRLLTGHLFISGDGTRWHFFYFDQRDYAPGANHWVQGAHMHFVNYLWPEFTAEEIAVQFTNGNPSMGGSIHIRFEDPTFKN